MKRKQPRSEFTTAVLAFIRLNPGSNVLNVHAGFPDATVKTVSNSLSSLWVGRYLSRVKGKEKNAGGLPLYDYTVKTTGPKRIKPVLRDFASTVDLPGMDSYSSGHQFDVPKSILDEAQEIIYGDREKTYGAPDKNLKMIGDLWAAYSGVPFTAEDVCNMMILLKVARLANDPKHRDSQVDLCGYAALMERIQK